jgi:Na+-driven multidrug efflux pump
VVPGRNLFPPLAVFMTAMMMTELVNCYLLGIGEARLALKINLVGFAAVAILAGPLLALFGALPGTCMTLGAADTIRLVAALVWLRRLIGSAG